LYGSETWSLTLREKQRLEVSENGVLRNRSEPKKDQVTEEWRRLHNRAESVLLTKYYSGDQIKKNVVQGMWHIWETGEVQTWSWWGD